MHPRNVDLLPCLTSMKQEETMFIEYKDGEKHTGKIDKAELSEDITTFNSCG